MSSAEPTVRVFLRRCALVGVLFLPMATVGTLSHEAGHWLAARALGCQPILHYASVTYRCASRPLTEVWQAALLTAGGPLQTTITGTLGLAWLFYLRRARPQRAGLTGGAGPLGRAGWAAALLALFWSRELFNALALALGWLILQRPSAFLLAGDEQKLSMLADLPLGTISAITGVAGAGVCLAVVGLTPRAWRLPLLCGGVAGSLVGFAAWMFLAGPLLLP